MKNDALAQKGNLPATPPRLTRHQQAVLELLHQQSCPQSAQELHGVLREHQGIGLATVYRALEALKLHGLAQSRTGVNGEALYSSVERDQHYLTCLQCGRSFPLTHCPVKDFEAHVRPSIPFKIYYHTLEFFGLCDPCVQETEARS
ncbi:MAG: Fur family transcriptional regulator [Leptolyngbyaceae bacterium]|nr:Fur family transcriptional regulator [Leptolyngbyaceae bacterium]